MRKVDNMSKILILQRTIPKYREALFSRLCKSDKYEVVLVISKNASGVKARNDFNDALIPTIKLTTYSIKILGRRFWYQKGLLALLKAERPSIIICEAESHFFAFWTAILYKIFFNRKVHLVQWCYYRLPGVYADRSWLHAWVKKMARSKMSHFISYTTLGKRYLDTLGISPSRVSVAVNVCSTEYWSKKFLKLEENKPRAERSYGIDPFKVVYAGSLVAEKHPMLMLDLANKMRDANCEFFVAGSGELEEEMRLRIDAGRLSNLKFLGRLNNDGMAELFHSADLLLLPGRGGIIISEAFCMGCPVVVYQGDGVELDLLTSRYHGNIIPTRKVNDFVTAIQGWIEDTERQKRSVEACCEVSRKFTTENMAQVFESVFYQLNQSK
tara:strand:- start:13915 stop:15066 length:1152 start_codon:yes stop_codon:yes gene_type:complete